MLAELSQFEEGGLFLKPFMDRYFGLESCHWLWLYSFLIDGLVTMNHGYVLTITTVKAIISCLGSIQYLYALLST